MGAKRYPQARSPSDRSHSSTSRGRPSDPSFAELQSSVGFTWPLHSPKKASACSAIAGAASRQRSHSGTLSPGSTSRTPTFNAPVMTAVSQRHAASDRTPFQSTRRVAFASRRRPGVTAVSCLVRAPASECAGHKDRLRPGPGNWQPAPGFGCTISGAHLTH
jgi:hypothetical protein